MVPPAATAWPVFTAFLRPEGGPHREMNKLLYNTLVFSLREVCQRLQDAVKLPYIASLKHTQTTQSCL